MIDLSKTLLELFEHTGEIGYYNLLRAIENDVDNPEK